MAEQKYEYEDLLAIIKTLRGENGCPWDKEQTHESLIRYLREETQEVVMAIEKKDSENLCEELGDLLYQILLHAQIAAEQGDFTMKDVVQGLSEKMVRRHPHVFGDVEIHSMEEEKLLWKSIKLEEKRQKNRILS